MKHPRLLILAILFIIIGFIGTIIPFRFASRYLSSKTWSCPMNRVMGNGMMNQTQMKEMMRNMMPGMLPPGIQPKDLPEPGSHGAKLVTRFCGQCHGLPNPLMHSATEWPAIADRMFARMSMMSGMHGMGMMGVENPSAIEQETIVGYLQKHSLKSIDPNRLPLEGSQAANMFRERCSRCHALPDPKMHTAKEWPLIVDRMQTNMKTMAKAVMPESEKQSITGYLVSHAGK